MLKNEPILAIRGFDTAEIWPSEVWDFEFGTGASRAAAVRGARRPCQALQHE